MRNRTVIWKALAALVVMLTIGACSGSPHQRSITLTFVRHAQSEANANGIIDTEVPGPGLTEEGQAKATELARKLARNHYDGVYASNMVRTQETAAPLAHELHKQVQVLPGLREVDAGWYDRTRSDRADMTYLVAPAQWLNGDHQDAIPGSVSGKEFNDQFTAAVQKIYDSGNTKPIAFSHGTSIMYWTLMNVKNPENSLAKSHKLPNGGRVVITGNPITGWTLQDWDGIHDFAY